MNNILIDFMYIDKLWDNSELYELILIDQNNNYFVIDMMVF